MRAASRVREPSDIVHDPAAEYPAHGNRIEVYLVEAADIDRPATRRRIPLRRHANHDCSEDGRRNVAGTGCATAAARPLRILSATV
jgi:hypothetical protein